VAARAAWRLQDWAAVKVEMEKVRDQAREQGERVIEALALTALGEATLKRDADPAAAKVFVDEALALLEHEDDLVAEFDALTVRATVASWQGDKPELVRYMENAYARALDGGRKDLQTIAAQALAQAHIMDLELDEAELLVTRALELAGESGSVRARVSATLAYGWFLTVKGELGAAETVVEEVRATSAELGVEPVVAAALLKLGWISRLRGDYKRSEKFLREALRIVTARGDRGILPDVQAALAETLADLGKVDEAERLAMEARANTGPHDLGCMVSATTAMAVVRHAQGRDPEADELFRSALGLAQESEFKVLELEPLERFVRFLKEREDLEAASLYEARLAELAPSPESTARIA
jgi:tetratricopeptide (TPR) repeat protein